MRRERHQLKNINAKDEKPDFLAGWKLHENLWISNIRMFLQPGAPPCGPDTFVTRVPLLLYI